MTARVVIVEDHVLVRDMFVEIAQDTLGLAIAAECDGWKEGMAACLRERPELAIVDWALPDGSGFDLMRNVAARLPRTRWICISATEREPLVREALNLGFHGFVLKRSDFATMRTAITAVLRGDVYYCPASSKLLVEGMQRRSGGSPDELTARECEVLRGIASGLSPKEIAADYGLALKTVHNHLANLKAKLGLREPADLIRYAIEKGLSAPL